MHALKKGFTLVELVVVITILAILTAIASVSYKSHLITARDGVRAADINNLSEALRASIVNDGGIPKPASAIVLTASGTIIGYQWYADATIASLLKSTEAKDPSDDTYYTYITDANSQYYQVLGFMEDQSAIAFHSPISFAYASAPASYSKRYIYTKGDKLGVLLQSGTLVPVQEAKQDIDVTKTNTGYVAVFTNDTSNGRVSGTGWTLVTTLSLTRPDGKSMIVNDPSLVGYWDISRRYSSGGIEYVPDMSVHKLDAVNNAILKPDGVSLGTIYENNSQKGRGGLVPPNGDVWNFGTNPFSVTLLFRKDEAAEYNDGSSYKDCMVFFSSVTYYTDGYNGNFTLRTSEYDPSIKAFNWEFATFNGRTQLLWWSYNYTGNQILTTNEWHRVTLVRNSTSLVFYLDENKIAESPFTGSVGPNAIGQAIAFGLHSYGCLHPYSYKEPRVYSRALSDGDVAALASQP